MFDLKYKTFYKAHKIVNFLVSNYRKILVLLLHQLLNWKIFVYFR